MLVLWPVKLLEVTDMAINLALIAAHNEVIGLNFWSFC